MATETTNSDDIIDVRNVIERVEELRDEIEAEEDAAKAGVTYDDGQDDGEFGARPWQSPDGSQHATESDAQDGALNALREELADTYTEVASLDSLLEDLCGRGGDHQWKGDWYPVTLIRDSYFEDYARQFAEDIGAIKRDMEWPCGCIDWEKAASQLQMDYSSTEFDGVTYWYR